MSLLNPMTWDLDFFLLRAGNAPSTKQIRKERIVLAGIYLATFSLSAFWLAQVTKYVPEPYLDEVFHIPQAQAYCRGEFNVWDPKLTTPPGLYIISTLLIRLVRGGGCTVLQLRATNCFTLILLLPAAHSCRRFITKRAPLKGSMIDWDAVHTAVNICLFPPIFFFSGLYYTDVLSTFIVLKAYEHFLQERWGPPRSTRGIFTYLIGAMALLMRQTNIFWVAVFIGGLELARTFPKMIFIQEGEDSPQKGRFNGFVMSCYHGAFHDPMLKQAGVFDFLWCAASLGAVTISHPIRAATRLWPYIALLISFAGFVLWNGGVVLGDKSNHVATLHLPQMLYIWPFMAFFSLPLLSSNISHLLVSFLRQFKWRAASVGRLPEFSTFIWLLGGTLVAISVIHFNTIIHPFTLADNRHYVFYVFRYTIRRHLVVKYQLAPVYVACAFFVLRTLAGYSLPYLDASVAKDKDGTTFQPRQSVLSDSLSTSSFPSTSFTLIWLISTALSLITAPLVEPRYFIIPWVIWRLSIPALLLASDIEGPEKDSNVQRKKKMDTSTSCWAGWTRYWAYEGHDYRLWLETIWFLLISLTTGAIFLFKGFEWPQEPGKVQRFMW